MTSRYCKVLAVLFAVVVSAAFQTVAPATPATRQQAVDQAFAV